MRQTYLVDSNNPFYIPSSFGIAAVGYGLDDRGFRAGARDFSFLLSVYNGCGAQVASYLMNTGDFFGCKVAGVWNWLF
jgi:hypothetical protein